MVTAQHLVKLYNFDRIKFNKYIYTSSVSFDQNSAKNHDGEALAAQPITR